MALVFTLCFAQDKTSYEYDNIPLSTALDSIRDQFEVAIIYQDNHVQDIFISATCSECNEYEALTALLKSTSLIWQKVGNQYIISKNGLKKKRSAINGFIREDATGEPISYANVFLKDSRYGNVSNSDGYYVITDIYPGEYTLIVSFMGYEKKEISIVLGKGKNLRQDHRLVKRPIEADEIIVSAERQKFLDMVEPSQITLDVREVSAMPAFIEADIFRAIQLLPGVHTLNDFISALYVRGGTPDQNLILLDGINVYHPFHLGGIFSTFNTDAIKEADFRSGGFPVKYGGRMGSVLMIKNREGNTEEFTGKANISILSSKAMIEGPLPDYKGIKGSWMLAGRRTYFDRIIKAGFDIADYIFRDNRNWEKGLPGFPYYFYDLEGKINLDLNDNHRLTLSSYFGDDILAINVEDTDKYGWIEEGQKFESKHYNLGKLDWRWGNFINSATWRWLISPELVLKTFVANSRFRFAIDLDNKSSGWDTRTGEDTTNYRNENYFDAFDKIDDKTIESELTWRPNPNHTITTGFQYKKIDFDLGLYSSSGGLQDSGFVLQADTVIWISRRPYEQSIYFQDKWTVSKNLSVQSGIRLYDYCLHDTLYFEPRLGIKYFIRENLSFKASMGRYHQFLTIVNPPDMNFAYVDLWMPIPEDRVASFSDHFVLGLEYITKNNVLLRIEAYKKSFNNLLSLNEEKIEIDEFDNLVAINPFNDFWDTQGRAHGIEILVKKQMGKIRGWVGYTYSSVEKKTIKHDWYHPNYDRTHALNIVGDWQWTERTHASIAITYMSGNPYTPIMGRKENIGFDWNDLNWNQRYVLGDKNSERYPDYFRCDVGFSKRKETKYGAREWYFDILNVTNHLNVLLYIHVYSDRKMKGLKMYKESDPGIYRFGVPMFPFMPTFGWRIEF